MHTRLDNLVYAMVCTRSALIAGVVNIVTGPILMSNTKTMKHVRRYLKGTDDFMLCFSESEGYSYVDWRGDMDRKGSPH